MTAFFLQRILLVLLASAFTCGSVCAQKDLSKSESEILNNLRLLYDKEREEVGQKQWAEPMENLRNKYKAQMERVQKNFEKSGDLQSALITRELVKSDPTPATINRKLPQLESVQSIFLEQKKAIELRFKQSLKVSAESHIAEAEAYKVKITKSGRLDYALAIDQLIREFRTKGRAAAGVGPRPINNQAKALNKGLVAYYPFNGNAKDESGNRNDGKVYGATLGTGRNGKANSAYSFDGVNNKIHIGQSILPTNGSDWTISMWVLRGVGDNSNGILFSQYGGHSNRLHIFADSYSLIKIFSSNMGGRGAIGYNMSSPQQWNHLVFSCSTNKIRAFENGISRLEGVQIANVANTKSLLGNDGNSKRWFEGLLDDIRIYNRALGEAEVKALYALEKP